MTSNDREGINIVLQPPPLPSSAQATLRLCCFLKLLLFCVFSHLLQSSHSIAFSSALKSNTCSRLCVDECKIASLTSFFLPLCNLSPEDSLNLNSVSMPSLLPNSNADNKVRVLPSPVPLSCTKTIYRSPYLVTIFSLPFNYWHSCHKLCL